MIGRSRLSVDHRVSTRGTGACHVLVGVSRETSRRAAENVLLGAGCSATDQASIPHLHSRLLVRTGHQVSDARSATAPSLLDGGPPCGCPSGRAGRDGMGVRRCRGVNGCQRAVLRGAALLPVGQDSGRDGRSARRQAAGSRSVLRLPLSAPFRGERQRRRARVPAGGCHTAPHPGGDPCDVGDTRRRGETAPAERV